VDAGEVENLIVVYDNMLEVGNSIILKNGKLHQFIACTKTKEDVYIPVLAEWTIEELDGYSGILTKCGYNNGLLNATDAINGSLANICAVFGDMQYCFTAIIEYYPIPIRDLKGIEKIEAISESLNQRQLSVDFHSCVLGYGTMEGCKEVVNIINTTYKNGLYLNRDESCQIYNTLRYIEDNINNIDDMNVRNEIINISPSERYANYLSSYENSNIKVTNGTLLKQLSVDLALTTVAVNIAGIYGLFPCE